MTRKLCLGTRASPLARAQSALVARALEARHPGLEVELVALETRGDKNRSVPLSAVDDPEFFAAEIRDALRAGTVDFAVHSLKDLASFTPPDLVRAALPVRAQPHDVVIFREDVRQRLEQGLALRIGSCSNRRQANAGAFLAEVLPAPSPPRLEFRDLRGGVDQRLARIAQPAAEPDALDGVVLALAGLERLWSDPDARRLVAPVLTRARWMVLPLSRCPAAAGQAVLALECRAADAETRARLGALHDIESEAAVAAEEAALSRWPEAQRAGFGASAISHEQLGRLCYIHGRASDDAAPVGGLQWRAPAPPSGPVIPWDGSSWRAHSRREHWPVALEDSPALFVAHWQAARQQRIPDSTRIWTSGVASWRALAAAGHWVEGCADHLGFDHLRPLLATPVLGLPALEDWTALTHEDAVASWMESGVGRVLASYRVSSPDDPATIQALREEARQATHFYWHSSQPLALLQDVLPAGAEHAAGPGKTPAALAAAGLSPVAFPNLVSWQQWLASA